METSTHNDRLYAHFRHVNGPARTFFQIFPAPIEPQSEDNWIVLSEFRFFSIDRNAGGRGRARAGGRAGGRGRARVIPVFEKKIGTQK